MSSRSTTMQPNAATTQNSRKMSSIAIRLCTKCRPSNAMMPPAMQPSSVERNIRRAMRQSSSTDSAPKIAAVKRQPKLSKPHIFSPIAIIHLPSGGWTTKPGSLAAVSSMQKPDSRALCATSIPWRSSDRASQA